MKLFFHGIKLKMMVNLYLDGVYKISVQGIDSDGNNVEKSTTVSNLEVIFYI